METKRLEYFQSAEINLSAHSSYPAKQFFKNEDIIKRFSDKKSVTTRRPLLNRECLKGYTSGRWKMTLDPSEM